jgi:AraC-like DNA-binding protein
VTRALGLRSPATFLSHAHGDIFQALRVSASILSAEPGWPLNASPQWRALYFEPNVAAFEYEHGVEGPRYEHNDRCVASAHRSRGAMLATHAGFADLFVPIVRADRVLGVLSVGPFATARPTSADVLERWKRLTGRQGHLADARFSHYVSATLATLVLEDDQCEVFEQFLTRLAQLMAGATPAAPLLADADALRTKLERARHVERHWASARAMVDEWTSRAWTSPHMRGELDRLGLAVAPDQLLVGMLTSLAHDSDPIDDLLRRDAFQRASVGLAQSTGGVVSGKIGDHGVTFLSGAKGSSEQRRKGLLDLTDRAASFARSRFGVGVYFGASCLPATAPLWEHYEHALGAAESALSRRARIVRSTSRPGRPILALGELRRQLAELVEQRPDLLPARFERFLETAATHCGYRLEALRAHSESAFLRIGEAFVGGGALDPGVLDDISVDLERGARDARTVSDLLAAYRRGVADLSDAAQRPASAQDGRRIQRGMAYVQQHYGEALRLRDVARAAGVSASHFSHLFKRHEGETLQHFVHQLRLERAKQLLVGTDLAVKRVAQMSGFATQHYFARMFRRATAMTPLDWRRRSRRRRDHAR